MRKALLILLAAMALSCHRREAAPPPPDPQPGFANMDAIPMPRRTEKEELDRTMADMKLISAAWEARATDVNTYKIGDRDGTVSASDLEAALAPTYLRLLPRTDAWHNAFSFSTRDDGGTYEIRSGGGPDQSGELVIANGDFTRLPSTAPGAR